jgi:rhomboid protease GluP
VCPSTVHRFNDAAGNRPIKNPRTESYCDFLLNAFCPVLKPCSFTVVIIIIDIIIFIAEVSVGLDRSGDFLQVKAQTLFMFKANNSLAVYTGEVYRLLTAIGLHVNFLHLILNVLASFIIVSRVEQTYKAPYTILFYFLSGIMGNIFSDVVNTNPLNLSAGASTAIYGMLGILLGYMIINWDGLGFMPPAFRCRTLVLLIFMLVFSVFFVSQDKSIDIFGHLGGLLGGLWLSGIPPSIIDTKK